MSSNRLFSLLLSQERTMTISNTIAAIPRSLRLVMRRPMRLASQAMLGRVPCI